jgi:hypothetical protein
MAKNFSDAYKIKSEAKRKTFHHQGGKRFHTHKYSLQVARRRYSYMMLMKNASN